MNYCFLYKQKIICQNTTFLTLKGEASTKCYKKKKKIETYFQQTRFWTCQILFSALWQTIFWSFENKFLLVPVSISKRGQLSSCSFKLISSLFRVKALATTWIIMNENLGALLLSWTPLSDIPCFSLGQKKTERREIHF